MLDSGSSRSDQSPESQPLSALDAAARNQLLPQTPVTLLQRIRQQQDRTAWDDLIRLLGPLVDLWIRQFTTRPDDRADIGQDVFLELAKRLPTWEYDARASFRGWLRTVTRSKCVDFFRKRNRLENHAELGQVAADTLPDPAEADEVRILTRSALKVLQKQIRPDVWRIFQQYVLEETPASVVANTCEVEVNYVYLVRSRLLAQLRGLLQPFRD